MTSATSAKRSSPPSGSKKLKKLSPKQKALLAHRLQHKKAKAEAKARQEKLARYWADPVAFVHECFHWGVGKGPTAYQDDTLARLPKHKRVAVRGPHGLGKTAMAAWVVLWFAITRDGKDWKVITTASVWRQLEVYLWPEIHKWARLLRWDVLERPPFTDGELLILKLKLATGAASAVASDNPALIEGAHADHILYLFDESKSIADDTFDAAEGAFAGAGDDGELEALALAVSTPGEPIGRFYNIHKRTPGFEDWNVRHVTLTEAIAAGRVSTTWAEQRLKQWGPSSAVYANRCLGEFASADEDSVIPLAWVERANLCWEEGTPSLRCEPADETCCTV
ncbi:MAG: hypothetical protein JXA57_17860 [Armatimonadetes bacterium]|nr:hypothetical protein [Armatimonadota bacterium]